MPNPGATITIELQALTDAANAKLTSFFRQIQNDAKAANTIAASSAANSVGNVAAGVESAAKAATTKIAGMSYYARSAIDGIRVALAGGGARAGFYAIDEAVRGLLASGMALSVLAPVLAGLAAAVGGGVLVWREYTSAEREAAKQAKDLHDSIKATADLLIQMKDLRKAGLLSDEAEQRNRDILSGKTKLYRNPETGDITDQPTSPSSAPKPMRSRDEAIDPGAYTPMPDIVQNTQLTRTEAAKYVQDKLSVEGGIDPEQIKAKAQLQDLTAEIHARSMSDLDAEIQKIHEKYEAEREEIKSNATVEGDKQLSQKEQTKVDNALRESEGQERVDIERKVQEQQTKVNEEYARGRAEFARLANEKLDKDLEESAATQGKTRGEIYQEEYDKRIALLQMLGLTGFLTEQQYTDAVKEAQARRSKGYRLEQEELRKINKLKEEMAQKDFEAEKKSIGSNPFLSNSQKNAQLQSLVGGQIAQTQLGLSVTNVPQNAQAQIEYLEQQKQLHQQLNGLLLEQQKLQQQAGTSFMQSFGAMFAHMKSEAEINFNTLAQTFSTVFNSAVNSISHGITGLIMGTLTWKQALLQVGESILTTLVQSVVQLAVRWIATQIMMAVAGKAIMAAATAAQAPLAAASAAIWSAPATLATIATFGAAAMAAPGFITAAEGMTLAGSLAAFVKGGYTGDGPSNEVAGLVHRGEFVIPADRVRQFGGGFFESIRNGALSPGSVPSSQLVSRSPGLGSGAGAEGVTLHNHNDIKFVEFGGEADAKRWADSEEGDIWFNDKLGRHIYKYQRS